MSNNQRKILYGILSILLASIFWLYVSVVTDPEGSTDIRAVPITFIGEEVLNSRNLYVFENITGTLRLTFDGRYTDISLLDNKNVSAVVDLSNITTSGTLNRAYDVKVPDNLKDAVKLTGRSSLYVDLFVDKIETKIINVSLVQNISAAEGYIAETDAAVVEPHEIKIKGPSSIIDKIEYAEVTLNDVNVNQSIDSIKLYKLKDIDGNEINNDNITSDTPEVHVSVPISKTKEVAIEADFRDGGGITLADNVIFSVTPETITISGDPADIEGINALKLPTIDLSKISSSGGRDYKIPIPNGCDSVSGQETATVQIEIFGVTSVSLNATNISVINDTPPEGYEVSILNETIVVQIRGPENAVAQVTPYNIRVVADLNGQELKPGQTYFTATAYVDGFPSVGAVGDYRVTVNIRKRADE